MELITRMQWIISNLNLSTARLRTANTILISFRANLPNLIPANISSYTALEFLYFVNVCNLGNPNVPLQSTLRQEGVKLGHGSGRFERPKPLPFSLTPPCQEEEEEESDTDSDSSSEGMFTSIHVHVHVVHLL